MTGATPLVTKHTSHISHHSSHVARHSSPVTYHTSQGNKDTMSQGYRKRQASKGSPSLQLRADHHGRACAADAVGVVEQTELPGGEQSAVSYARGSITCCADSPFIALSANAAGELRSVKFSAIMMLLPNIHK